MCENKCHSQFVDVGFVCVDAWFPLILRCFAFTIMLNDVSLDSIRSTYSAVQSYGDRVMIALADIIFTWKWGVQVFFKEATGFA